MKYRIRNKMKQALHLLVTTEGGNRNHTLASGESMLLTDKEMSGHLQSLADADRISISEIPDLAPEKVADVPVAAKTNKN